MVKVFLEKSKRMIDPIKMKKIKIKKNNRSDPIKIKAPKSKLCCAPKITAVV